MSLTRFSCPVCGAGWLAYPDAQRPDECHRCAVIGASMPVYGGRSTSRPSPTVLATTTDHKELQLCLI